MAQQVKALALCLALITGTHIKVQMKWLPSVIPATGWLRSAWAAQEDCYTKQARNPNNKSVMP